MANLSKKVDVQDGNAPLTGLTKTADFTTDGFNPGQCRFLGARVKISTVTVTTLDIGVQITFDGGTTWLSYDAGASSATQAALTQMTAAADEYRFWTNGVPFEADPNIQVRLNFDVNGTTYDIDFAEWMVTP